MTTKLMVQERISALDSIKIICEKAEKLEKIADDLINDPKMLLDVRRRGCDETLTLDNLLTSSVDRNEIKVRVSQMLREYADEMKKRAKADYEKILDEMKGADDEV